VMLRSESACAAGLIAMSADQYHTLALTKTPGVMLLLHEHDTTFRQIFMDGAAVARGSFPDMTHTPVVGAMR
jgi:hypothetical protein